MHAPDSAANPAEISRILAIRLQAMGDVTIALPYVAALRSRYPDSRIDFLTNDEWADLPGEIDAIDRVIRLGGGRNRRLQFLSAITMLPRLISRRYSLVADLQDNRISRLIRRFAGPSSTATFDRLSPIAAGDRNQRYLEEISGEKISPHFSLRPKSAETAIEKFSDRIGTGKFVVLNPAGVLPSRNWPLENYVEFARLWAAGQTPETRFVLIGVDHLADKATQIERGIGSRCVNLVGETTTAEAFGLVSRARLILTEDSGLMHMAWTCGVPTVALFGSSRSDWSRPLGPHSICLSSSDLDCGECMQATCRFGDNRCLTRHSPQDVVTAAVRLLETQR